MNKQEALRKIEELEENAADLRRLVIEMDKEPKELVRTFDVDRVKLNDIVVMHVWKQAGTFNAGAAGDAGSRASGYGSVARLHSDGDGQWFDEDGKKIGGSLYYKPSGE